VVPKGHITLRARNSHIIDAEPTELLRPIYNRVLLVVVRATNATQDNVLAIRLRAKQEEVHDFFKPFQLKEHLVSDLSHAIHLLSI
jgi:hypothetical protein